MTDTYTVTAKRWARGWELHVDGVGVTQAGSLSRAESTAREYIAFALGIEDDQSFDVDIVPQLDSALAEQVKSARAQVRDAQRKQLEAAAKQREVARSLGRSGLSGREIAAVLGLTPQRVSQLIGASSDRSAAKYVTPDRRAAARSKPVAGRRSRGGGRS